MKLVRSMLILAAVTLAAPTLVGQEAREATLRVLVPSDATLLIDGIKTRQTGSVRLFVTPPLRPGKNYYYVITATWLDNGKAVERVQKVQVIPGREVELDLRDGVASESPRPAPSTTQPSRNPDKPAPSATQPSRDPAKPAPSPDSPYVPTPQEVVEKMLELAKVTKDDVVYDLGCGDGRIVVTAAKKYGARGVGVDIDPQRIKESKENALKNNVADKVEIREGDCKDVNDLDKATVVTLYLLPDHIKAIEPNLKKQLKPGTRIVAHDFAIEDWEADQEVEFKAAREHTLYVYVVKGADKPKEVKQAKEEKDVKEEKKLREPDVIFVPTPQEVVDKMLEMAKVTKNDVLYDLGCGDGRIPVTAAKKYGAKAIGIDIDPQRIRESNENVKKNNVGDKVTIKHADIFKEDLTPATVVTLYLLPRLNVKLIPQLEKLKPGTRIVSHDFNMEGYKPDQMVRLRAKDDDGNEDEHIIYMWTIPLKKE